MFHIRKAGELIQPGVSVQRYVGANGTQYRLHLRVGDRRWAWTLIHWKPGRGHGRRFEFWPQYIRLRNVSDLSAEERELIVDLVEWMEDTFNRKREDEQWAFAAVSILREIFRINLATTGTKPSHYIFSKPREEEMDRP